MTIPYFGHYKWQELTRDERFFCGILHAHANSDAPGFARWLIETTGLAISPEGDWDVGFEVCFYRDMLWHMGDSAPNKELPPKRTFDLCLFGERDIVVIEAKVYEPFDAAQNEEFDKDKRFLRQVPGLEQVTPHVIALASSKYFENAKIYGRKDVGDKKGTLHVFNGKHLTWQQAAAKYGNDPLLYRADELYNSKERKLLPEKQQGNQA